MALIVFGSLCWYSAGCPLPECLGLHGGVTRWWQRVFLQYRPGKGLSFREMAVQNRSQFRVGLDPFPSPNCYSLLFKEKHVKAWWKPYGEIPVEGWSLISDLLGVGAAHIQRY